MDESKLKEILNLVEPFHKNYYSEDISLNLLDIAKEEMDALNLVYEPFIFKNKERLKIYDGNNFIKDYNKNFYQNNSMFGFKISNNKLLTERYLKLANIPTTNSLLLSSSQFEKAVNFLQNNTGEKVIKPLDLSNGRGVFLNVDINNLEYFWNECLDIQKKYKVKNPKVLIQDIIKGFEVRVIVTEGKVLSATLRTPPYVIGDGKSNLEKLIDFKNVDRNRSKFFRGKEIKKNKLVLEYLKKKKLDLKTVLKKDEICILYPLSNLINGGENIVVTHLMHPEVIELARKTVLAIPGLHTAGIDIMIENFQDSNAYILEVNKAPAFQLNYYPYIGEVQKPLNYIFSSLVIEDRILNDRISLEKLKQEELNIIIERYKFLYQKQRKLSDVIERLEK